MPDSRQYTMEAAVYGARLMNVFERTSPLVAMSSESDLVNGWPGGIIQASRHRLFVSPLYFVNLLYNRFLGRDRLKTTIEGPTFDTSQEGSGVSVLDAVSSRSADGSRLYLKLVNTQASAVPTRIELRGVEVAADADWHLLMAESPQARNGFATPDAIQPRREAVQAGGSFELPLPPQSVSVLVLKAGARGSASGGSGGAQPPEKVPIEALAPASSAEPPPKKNARATFAGGCFWSMEAPFDKMPGVVSTTSGFAGGFVPHPTYEQVAMGKTGHAEVVQVVFDPRRIAYERLLEVFWRNIDPFDGGGQFCDRGSQYRTAIFYEGDDQKQAALASRESLARSGKLPGPIMTEIAALEVFYPAEPSHQDYYLRNTRQYWSYSTGCGRDRRLKQLWGDQ